MPKSGNSFLPCVICWRQKYNWFRQISQLQSVCVCTRRFPILYNIILTKGGRGGGGAPPEWGLFAKRDIGNQGNKGFPGVPANPVEGNRIGPTDNLGQSLESILQNTLGRNVFFATPMLLHIYHYTFTLPN